MTTRILPESEWHRLDGTEAESLWPHLRGTDAQVLVVENEAGEIVGTWTVLRMVHVECVWIREDHRGTYGVTKRLITAMRETARALGARAVQTGALTEQVRGLIRSLGGTALPGEQYIIPVEKT